MPVLEIIATGREDLAVLEKQAVERVELVSALERGGLTPDDDLIRDALSRSFETAVMLRPHDLGFCYETAFLKAELERFQALGVKRVVFGALTADGRVDLRLLHELFDPYSFRLTFHRAIDESRDLLEAVRDLESLPFVTLILTSGGQDKATEGLETIQQMINSSSKRIMVGSGLSASDLPHLLKTLRGDFDVHMGSAVRVANVDPKKLREVQTLLK